MRSWAPAVWIVAAIASLTATEAARCQTSWDPNAVDYAGPPEWQRAAVAALNRHLPTDSGYWVLGPLDFGVEVFDTFNVIPTTLRILAPDPASSRTITRRLWVPTGGVALEELQPADTLAHEFPPGYSGRVLKGSIAGERTLVQVFTVQEHRWLLWARRVEVAGIRQPVGGPVARYSIAVAGYLAAVDSGRRAPPPRAGDFGLEPIYDLYAEPPEPVVRDAEGYLGLLHGHRAFSLGNAINDVYGFIPSPALSQRLESSADAVLFLNKEGDAALQSRYRDFESAGGGWSDLPVLTSRSLLELAPGRYVYATDRYGVTRVAPSANLSRPTVQASPALLAHGDPVRAAGELLISAEPGGRPRLAELNVRSEEYFFSNRSLTLYEDVERRSSRYVAAVAHVLAGLEQAGVPTEDVLIRKY
ncbi:MAG: hypothetical protein JSU87_02065 [Gemmatimonadota bacterium]|nr:MAG: hypothetical protein JSU87_02065 [Gemmatimonadota bacterium]